MGKLDDFKLFIKENPHLIDKVHNNEVTWQKLYETYDIYGTTHEIFNKQINKKIPSSLLTKDGINNAINIFKDIDLDKLSNGLDSLKKVVGTIQEITKPEGELSSSIPEYLKKSSFRRYND